MKLKLWIAGAIVALVAVCAVAVSAASLTTQGQAAEYTDNGTRDSQVSTPAAAATPSVSPEGAPPEQAARSMYSVSGGVVGNRGNGLAGKFVTLHAMGYNHSGGHVASVWEVYSLTTTTAGGADAGKFVFDNVIVTPDTQYWYVSSYTTLPDGTTTCGISNNFTLEDNYSSGFIVLFDPQDVDPDRI